MKTNKDDQNQTPSPYGIDKLSNIKPGVKIRFLKFWMAGAAYLLSYMTPPLLSQDGSTELLALFIILTLMTEYIANNFITWMNHDKSPTYDYLPFGYINRKSVKSLFSTMLYIVVMIAVVYGMSYLINITFNLIKIPTLAGLLTGDSNSMEPITFGLLFILADYIWFISRKAIIKMIKRKGN